ncbi:hypothetical protein FC26_GL001787 [Paucilactobacillus vaccinostercus DSM 20634]|jgi:predicted transcriptional regulator|uniref:CBS domain-containing protein n=2 Tax=Paucilactobacillus vaccinostercus TaxID=176291 RepID=A0A0R2A314_9LACO|nr:hypothetical protein FC26_GL001787 [Paucilactobacillus vaccinostercus DSM 20634]
MYLIETELATMELMKGELSMINSAVEHMLTENKEKFLIPANIVANVLENNNLYHAFLVLTRIKYAKIVVLDNDGRYKGLLSLAMITEQMFETETINVEKLKTIKVADVMQTDAPTISDPYDVEQDLHLLTDQPFLPVVADNGDFTGIVTRRELFKAINHLVHDIDEEYDIITKDQM